MLLGCNLRNCGTNTNCLCIRSAPGEEIDEMTLRVLDDEALQVVDVVRPGKGLVRFNGLSSDNKRRFCAGEFAREIAISRLTHGDVH